MAAILCPCELAPVLRSLRCSVGELAAALGVSRRSLHRYLASGRAPPPVCALAALPEELRRRLPPDRKPEAAERARLIRVAEGWAANHFEDLARQAYAAAHITGGEADARLAGLFEQQRAAEDAAERERRARHAAYMRAARAAGRYREPTTRRERARWRMRSREQH